MRAKACGPLCLSAFIFIAGFSLVLVKMTT